MIEKQSELNRLGDLIELEMKNIGLWNAELNLSENPKEAFGRESLKFEEWLQAVFLPNLRISVSQNKFPTKSQVAIAAIRNFDGLNSADELINLLSQVDDIINNT
ncbi:MAG TPA: YqcC family protein [Fibrobacteria bacterium]|nr:YqcC family protein [Fibrobacteria bacterium]